MENIWHKLNKYPRYFDDSAWTRTLDIHEIYSRFSSWIDHIPASISLRIRFIKK